MSAILKQKLIDIANGFTKYGLWKGGGSSNLSELDDVNLTNLQTNDVLTYNGSVWVNDDNLQKQIDTLNSNLSLLNKFEGVLLGGHDKEIYFNPGDYFEITVIGLLERMGKIIGQFRSNGTPDYWVYKPSESLLQVSGNTNRIIIGNPSGHGSIIIFVKIFKVN